MEEECLRTDTIRNTPNTGVKQSDEPPGQNNLYSPLADLLSSPTLEGAIQAYLQEQVAAGRCPKTLEWHQTALPLFRQYLMTERHMQLANGITAADVHAWLAFLRTAPSATGAPRSPNAIATYARSARAFCHWLIQQGHLEHSPFTTVCLPAEPKTTFRLLESTEFEHLLQACQLPDDPSFAGERAAARNRALLWVVHDTGMRTAEVCNLRLGDVDYEQRSVQIQGQGARARLLALSLQGWRQLLCYLEEHRLRGMAAEGGSDPKDFLFLSELYQPLTPNALILLCARLQRRVEIASAPINPSVLRDTFAVRFLQAGGNRDSLRERLGLDDLASVKRYQRFHEQLIEHKTGQGSPEEQISLCKPQRDKRRRWERGSA